MYPLRTCGLLFPFDFKLSYDWSISLHIEMCYIYGSILVLDMCPSCKVLVVARLFVLSGTKMCQNAYSIRQMTVYQLDLMKVISHGTQLKKV